MRSNHPHSEIEMQVMWNRLIAVVEEQAQTLVRTAFGTATREAGDLSAGVYDQAGNMVAQAVTGTPGHINSMAKSVGHVLAKFPLSSMSAGDVFVTNNPWMGTGHFNDIVVVTPTFRGADPVALFACTLHVVDIGGRGVPGAASEIYEEGLHLPILKLVDRGRVNDMLFEIVAENVREPVQVVGDIYSEIACNEIGGRRLIEMMSEYGLSDIEDLSGYVFDRSRQATLEAIRALPFGTYRNVMTVDGIDKPLDLCAAVTIGADGIDVDFTGTAPVSARGINVPICYTEAYTSFGVKCIVAPRIPNNAASLAPIRVTAPEGSILNAPHPAPVQARHIVGQMLPDVVFGCLRQAIPDGVPAEGTSCLWNVRLTGGPGRVEGDPASLRGATTFNVTGFHSGGAGARPRQDGLSATAFPSGVRNVPVEITESMAPVIIHRKEYRTDSGGAGAFRGGLGQVMEIGTAEDMPFAIATTFDRIDHPARGVEGGAPGMPGRVGTTAGRQFSGKGFYTIQPNERLIVEMPGGGGYGAPLRRDPALVARDVRDQRLSVEAARTRYGVVVSPDGVLDTAATAECRPALAGDARQERT